MRKILWQDVVMIAGFCIYLAVGFITKFLISKVASVEGYREAALELEGNPIAREALKYRYGFVMMQWSSIATLGAVYYMLRRRFMRAMLNREIEYNVLGSYSIGLFLLFLQNIMNDLPIMLGMIMGG